MKGEDIIKEISRLKKELEEREQEVILYETAFNQMVSKFGESQIRIQQVEELNKNLNEWLKQARDAVKKLNDELDELKKLPYLYAFFKGFVDKVKRLIDAVLENRIQEVFYADPAVNLDDLRIGMRLRITGTGIALAVVDEREKGEEMYFDCWLSENRLRVQRELGDERFVVMKADSLEKDLEAGDPVIINSAFAFEKTPKDAGDEYFLAEIPDVTFDDIGALDEQIKIIKDELQLPFLHPDIYKEYGIPLPKGILLYGPPGCGKTMLAKAIANSLNERINQLLGKSVPRNFININGPELLNKYVGETERKIREIFKAGKKFASNEFPVIIFFDEIDSFFRARGIGISSDMESTIVPTLCSELDGLVGLKNIIVIGATNRPDLLDPAVLRPGRFDIKMKVERPRSKEEAKQIFLKKLKAGYKLHEKYNNQPDAINYIIDQALISVFSKEDEICYKDNEGREQVRNNKYVELIDINHVTNVLYYADLILSGALIENIVNRAKKMAAKMTIEKQEPGLRARYLCAAVQREYDENEDLPNTTNPDEWAKILGIKDKIIGVNFIRKLKKEEKRKIETINVGHYL